jgi:hypothetical protein
VTLWSSAPYAAPIVFVKGAAPREIPDDWLRLGGGSAGVKRIHLDVTGTDLAETYGPVTGDVFAITGGRGVMAGRIVASISDPAAAKTWLRQNCPNMGGMYSHMTWIGSGCVGEMDLDRLIEGFVQGFTKHSNQAPPTVPEIRFALEIEVAGDSIVATVGDAPATTGSFLDDMGDADAVALMKGRWTAVDWTRGFELLFALPSDLRELFARLISPNGHEQEHLRSWLFLHIYDLTGASRPERDGTLRVWHFTTFGGDPPEARDAYARALDRWMASDRDGWRDALREVAAKHPSTRIGRQAQFLASDRPVIGPLWFVTDLTGLFRSLLAVTMLDAHAGRSMHEGLCRRAIEVVRSTGHAPAAAPPTRPLDSCCSDAGATCRPESLDHETWKQLGLLPSGDSDTSYELIRGDCKGCFTIRSHDGACRRSSPPVDLVYDGTSAGCVQAP